MTGYILIELGRLDMLSIDRSRTPDCIYSDNSSSWPLAGVYNDTKVPIQSLLVSTGSALEQDTSSAFSHLTQLNNESLALEPL